MKVKKNSNPSKIQKTALRLLAGSTNPIAEPLGGDWPWCAGIIYQPKHPRLIEAERITKAKPE